MTTHHILAPLALASLLIAAPAGADEPPPSPNREPVSEPAPTDADAVAEEARVHHRRAVELYDDGALGLALVEFDRAYAIGGSYKILFNIGQVHLQMNNYAKARRALERYLALGGDGITTLRRAAVERDLATLRARTATLTVRVNVADAEVSINDAPMGNAPLERTLVDAGTLRVQVTKPGYAVRVREIALAGGDQQIVTVDLVRTDQNVVIAPQALPGVSTTAIIGWVATGVLAIGAIGTGVGASSAASSYNAQRDAPIQGSPQEARVDLERQRDLVRGLALTTDILVGAAALAGGVSLYLTLREKPKVEAPRVRIQGASATLTVGF